MDRKEFLNLMAILPLTTAAMQLNALSGLTSTFNNTGEMPVLFLGHGSPMNAIEENEFVKGFRSIASEIPKPNAILCISAHWETRGTYVTAMPNPKTIHDFGGFPQALFDVQYPAPGSPQLAKETQELVQKTLIQLDDKWGLDHGAWSVIKHLYPEADVPVIQLSLNYSLTPGAHYELAQELHELRRKGVLIIGSGNIVHNLRLVNWKKLNETYFHDWAAEADHTLKKSILSGDHQQLINYQNLGKAVQTAIPTPEHFLPLLYVLALQTKKDSIELFNDKPLAGSLTMTSIKIG